MYQVEKKKKTTGDSKFGKEVSMVIMLFKH